VSLCQIGMLFLNLYDFRARHQVGPHSILEKAEPRTTRRIRLGHESQFVLEAPEHYLRELQLLQSVADSLQLENGSVAAQGPTNANIMQFVLAYVGKIWTSIRSRTDKSGDATRPEHAAGNQNSSAATAPKSMRATDSEDSDASSDAGSDATDSKDSHARSDTARAENTSARPPQNVTTEIKIISNMHKDVSAGNLNRSLENINRYVAQSIVTKMSIGMIRSSQLANLAEQLLSFENMNDESFSLFVHIFTLHLTRSTNHKDVLESCKSMMQMHANCEQHLLQQLINAYNNNISDDYTKRNSFDAKRIPDCKTKLQQLLQHKSAS